MSDLQNTSKWDEFTFGRKDMIQSGSAENAVEVPSRLYRAQTGLENEHGARVEAGDIIPLGFVPAWQLQYWLAQGDVTMTEAVVIDPSDGVNDDEASAASEVLHQRRKQKRGEQ